VQGIRFRLPCPCVATVAVWGEPQHMLHDAVAVASRWKR
jgi:hypothetical protein